MILIFCPKDYTNRCMFMSDCSRHTSIWYSNYVFHVYWKILPLPWMSVCLSVHLSVRPSVRPSVTHRVRYISPRRHERFSWKFVQMFTSSRSCAEPMSQPCWLKVKVTIEGHMLESKFCVRSITHRSFEKFTWNFGQMFTSRQFRST